MRKPELVAKFLERIPVRRAGEAWEIAKPAVFLASDAASYITAASLLIDGGWATTTYPDLSECSASAARFEVIPCIKHSISLCAAYAITDIASAKGILPTTHGTCAGSWHVRPGPTHRSGEDGSSKLAVKAQ